MNPCHMIAPLQLARKKGTNWYPKLFLPRPKVAPFCDFRDFCVTFSPKAKGRHICVIRGICMTTY